MRSEQLKPRAGGGEAVRRRLKRRVSDGNGVSVRLVGIPGLLGVVDQQQRWGPPRLAGFTPWQTTRRTIPRGAKPSLQPGKAAQTGQMTRGDTTERSRRPASQMRHRTVTSNCCRAAIPALADSASAADSAGSADSEAQRARWARDAGAAPPGWMTRPGDRYDHGEPGRPMRTNPRTKRPAPCGEPRRRSGGHGAGGSCDRGAAWGAAPLS